MRKLCISDWLLTHSRPSPRNPPLHWFAWFTPELSEDRWEWKQTMVMNRPQHCLVQTKGEKAKFFHSPGVRLMATNCVSRAATCGVLGCGSHKRLMRKVDNHVSRGFTAASSSFLLRWLYSHKRWRDITYPAPISCTLGMGMCCFFPGHTAFVLPQFLSSELSPQSFSPLHSNLLEMQRPGQEKQRTLTTHDYLRR